MVSGKRAVLRPVPLLCLPQKSLLPSEAFVQRSCSVNYPVNFFALNLLQMPRAVWKGDHLPYVEHMPVEDEHHVNVQIQLSRMGCWADSFSDPARPSDMS